MVAGHVLASRCEAPGEAVSGFMAAGVALLLLEHPEKYCARVDAAGGTCVSAEACQRHSGRRGSNPLGVDLQSLHFLQGFCNVLARILQGFSMFLKGLYKASNWFLQGFHKAFARLSQGV